MNKLLIILMALFIVGCPGGDMDKAYGQSISTTWRDSAISFVLKHEGGYVLYLGVDYNYGLSGKYYGNTRHISIDSATQIYKQIWAESNAERLADSCMALVYFDTYVMFTPTLARELLTNCYDPRSYLLKRLSEHMTQIKKDPSKKEHLLSWDRRICDLFKLCQ